MFCQKCGVELSGTGLPCPKCGHRARGVGWFIGRVALVILVALGIITAARLASAHFGGNHGSGPSVTAATINLGSRAFTLGARQYEYVGFTVGPDMGSPYVIGHFLASGGGGNDVRVLLLGADGFVNYRNGHQFRDYYDSGQVTTDHLNIGPLAPGKYDLVYSNRFSIFTSKAIASTIRLQFQRF